MRYRESIQIVVTTDTAPMTQGERDWLIQEINSLLAGIRPKIRSLVTAEIKKRPDLAERIGDITINEIV